MWTSIKFWFWLQPWPGCCLKAMLAQVYMKASYNFTKSQTFTSLYLAIRVEKWTKLKLPGCFRCSSNICVISTMPWRLYAAGLLSRISAYVKHCPRCWWMPVLFTQLQLAMLVLIIWGPLQRWDGCIWFTHGKHELTMSLHKSVCLIQSPQRELRTVLWTARELQRALVLETRLICKPACSAHTLPWRTSEVNDRLTNSGAFH